MLVLWGTVTGLLVYGTWLTIRHLSREPQYLDAPFALYPVSILKPLKGSDPDLRENLQSFFNLEYPRFELLFSLADSRDSARPIVEELMRANPSVSAKLVIGELNIGTNPKVNNLLLTYKMARYDWLLISDSNIRVEKNYLKRMVAQLDAGVGMITSVVMGTHSSGVGARLDEVYLNTFYARGMILTAHLGRPCVVGKSMLFRRSTAERFGGIQALGQFLAEDYMAGEAMRLLGQKISISVDPICQFLGDASIKSFWHRHIRWGRIRKAQAPLAFLFEPVITCVGSGFLGSMAFSYFFGFSALNFFCAHHLLWLTCDLVVVSALGAEVSLTFPFFWLVREFLHLPLWAHASSGNTVKWRGKKLQIMEGGLTRPCQKNA